MKKISYNLYSKILEYIVDNYFKSSFFIVFDDVVNITGFSDFLKSIEQKKDFFYPNIVSFDGLENSKLSLFRIIIIMKILRGYFSADIGYAQVFEYAVDLSDFINDFYVFNLSKKNLKELSTRDNNFDFIIRCIEVYEKFLDFLLRDDIAIIYKRYFISIISLVKKVLHVSSKKKSIRMYGDVLYDFFDKIEELRHQRESYFLREDIKILYNEFSSLLDKASFIAFYINQKISISERVVVISDNEELNNLILFNLKKFGHDTDENTCFSKTELYKVSIGIAEVILGCDALYVMDLLKNSYMGLNDDFIRIFEDILCSVSVIENNILDLLTRVKEKISADSCEGMFEERYMQVIELVCCMIKNCPNQDKIDIFDNWMVLHKKVIKKLVIDKYSLEVDLFFYFVRDSVRDILKEQISFVDYVDIFKKISGFFGVYSRNGLNKNFTIIDSLASGFVDAEHVIFADVSEGIFPKKERINYWVNEFDREKLELVDKFSISDFYEVINSAKKSCLIVHSSIDGSKRSHFVDVLLNEYAEKVESYDLSEYNAYKRNMLDWVKDFFIKNVIKPPLPVLSPSIAIRPKKFSATEVGYLVKNPYKIYAKYILSLRELNFYNVGLKYISKGNIVHEKMQDIFKNHEEWNYDTDTGIDKLWGYNLGQLYEYYTDEVKTFGENYQKSYLEVSAKLRLGEFTISARADRVDIFKDGGISIIDYKTGTLPSKNSIKEMINPQILVEGIIFKYGNVPIPNIKFIRQLKLVKLPRKLGIVDIEEKNTALDELVGQSKDKLLCILENSLREPYEAYKIKENNMENDPVFLLSRAHEVLY